MRSHAQSILLTFNFDAKKEEYAAVPHKKYQIFELHYI